MKFSYSWLKEHLEPTASFEEIVERLSLIGLEVEGVEDKAKALSAFVVGEILTVQEQAGFQLNIAKWDDITLSRWNTHARTIAFNK